VPFAVRFGVIWCWKTCYPRRIDKWSCHREVSGLNIGCSSDAPSCSLTMQLRMQLGRLGWAVRTCSLQPSTPRANVKTCPRKLGGLPPKSLGGDRLAYGRPCAELNFSVDVSPTSARPRKKLTSTSSNAVPRGSYTRFAI